MGKKLKSAAVRAALEEEATSNHQSFIERLLDDNVF